MEFPPCHLAAGHDGAHRTYTEPWWEWDEDDAIWWCRQCVAYREHTWGDDGLRDVVDILLSDTVQDDAILRWGRVVHRDGCPTLIPPPPIARPSGGVTYLYRLFDENDVLLYVGITTNTHRRFAQHAWEKLWWPMVARKRLEKYPSRAQAVAAEGRAIRFENPIMNVQMAVSSKVAV